MTMKMEKASLRNSSRPLEILDTERALEQFVKSIRKWHGRTHYEYQLRIARGVIDAVVKARDGKTSEVPIELPRQSGKTTILVDVVEFILVTGRWYFGGPKSIGLFAPQKEQAATDFDRLKTQIEALSSLAGLRTRITEKKDVQVPQKWNSKTIRLYNDQGARLGEVYIFPVSKTSRPESKTFDVILFEEMQDVDDERAKNAVFPMGAATNAPRIYVGTAGYKLCYFKQQIENNPEAVVVKLQDVFKQRADASEKTGDKEHLKYQQYVEHEIKENGPLSDYIRTQYFLEWRIGSGQFATQEDLNELLVARPFELRNEKRLYCYVGIDVAKIKDRTVVTVIRDREVKDPKQDAGKSDLLAWLSLQGDNYEDQFEIIHGFLRPFKEIRMIAIDSTGQGDFMPDKFQKHARFNLERVSFTMQSKDIMYKILLQVIRNKLTSIPNMPEDDDFKRWKRQMLNLQKEQKGRFLSVHHPDSGEEEDKHDDYPDSWALAEYAKALATSKGGRISFV